MAAKAFRKPLSRERVLTAAVALVDTQGIQALTMRRLAADLHVEAMSLYYHLADKEALLDGVVETVVAEIGAAVGRVGETGGDRSWRTRLREQFLAARQVMLGHPWVPGVLSGRRSIPAGVIAYYDSIVGTLVGAGFSYHLAHRALHAFGSLPLGFAQEIFSPASAGGDVAADAGLVAQADADPAARAEVDPAAMAATMPYLTKMMAAEIHDAADPTLGWCDSQVEFEFTVNLLLDGLDRLRVDR